MFICLCFINSPKYGTGTVSNLGLSKVKNGTDTVSILIPTESFSCTEFGMVADGFWIDFSSLFDAENKSNCCCSLSESSPLNFTM